MLNRTVVGVFFMLTLTACTTEQNYRGVQSPVWHDLTGEQKQLIVDQAYEKDFGQPPKKL